MASVCSRFHGFNHPSVRAIEGFDDELVPGGGTERGENGCSKGFEKLCSIGEDTGEVGGDKSVVK